VAEDTPAHTPPTPETNATSGADAAPRRLPTAYITGDVFLNHQTPPGFPERPERLREAQTRIARLIEAGTIPPEKLLQLDPRPATAEDLAAVHTPAYIESIRDAVEHLTFTAMTGGPTIRRFATDVYLSPGTYDAATHAAGAALVALDAIAQGRARNGYALVRPPGHHATADHGMGFCIFNNIAVAARYAQRRYGWQRVLIVDYDVHHGNGTQGLGPPRRSAKGPAGARTSTCRSRRAPAGASTIPSFARYSGRWPIV
jgi:acetoin utilization deacetylase AcuC-like enzyme